MINSYFIGNKSKSNNTYQFLTINVYGLFIMEIEQLIMIISKTTISFKLYYYFLAIIVSIS